MNRTHRVVRASFYLSLALPLAALACGQEFTAGSGDGGDEGGIVFGDGGAGQDGTTDAGHSEGGADARHDGPHDGGSGDGMAETGTSCPPGSIACSDGGCAQEGPTNCGSCGNDCTMLPHVMGAQCNAGQCAYTCEPGWQNCTTNQNTGCTTDITKQGNCGACGVTCSGNTPLCSGTGCVSGCDAGQTICSGSCTNTATDPQNCSQCGMVCPNNGPAHSEPSCTNSMCGSSCVPSYTACNGLCTLATPDPTTGVFVAPGGATGSCGAATRPCATIAEGLQALTGNQNTLYVAEGTYTEQVTLPAGVTISGGWIYQGAGWTRDCASPSKTIIQAPAGSLSAVVASYSSGSSTLDTLTIGNSTTAGAGVSLYGVSASNAQATSPGLILTSVTIDVAAGGSGINGTDGGAGALPGPSCPGATPGGVNGSNGDAGAGAGQGQYGPNGYQPQAGATAQNGQDGQNGSPAPMKGQTNGPTCVTAYSVGGGNYNTDQSCCTANMGGGNYCGTCTGGAQSLCGTAGTSGCGSGGSNGGAGGTGGGASVGVFAYNFAITLNQVTITTGSGGTGGNGGLGGGVVSGTVAAAGDAGPSAYTMCTLNCGPLCLCAPTGATVRGSAGIAGGNGGTGGVGGQGGGGAGGDSLCYATAGTAMVSMLPSITCNAGSAGTGGNAGLPNQGASGRQGLHN